MARIVRNPEGWTLRKLIQNTYHHMSNRFDYRSRDVLKRIYIQKVDTYDGKNLGESDTKFTITTQSYPQYRPYYTGTDSRGRRISKQRKYRHEYDITIQMGSLSLDEDRIRLRTGSDKKWDFSKKGRPKTVGKGRSRKVIEGTNAKNAINGDHFFRLSYIRKHSGILYGRNYAGWFPKQTNPHGIQFLTKHELRALKVLIDRGILQ